MQLKCFHDSLNTDVILVPGHRIKSNRRDFTMELLLFLFQINLIKK